MGSITLDAASSEDLLLSSLGLLIGLILEDLDVTSSLDDGTASGNESPVLKSVGQNLSLCRIWNENLQLPFQLVQRHGLYHEQHQSRGL